MTLTCFSPLLRARIAIIISTDAITISTIRGTIDLQVQSPSSGFFWFLSSVLSIAAIDAAVTCRNKTMKLCMRPSHMRSTTTKPTTSPSRQRTTLSQVWCSPAWCRELTIFLWEWTPTCKASRCLYNSSSSISSQAACKWLHPTQSRSTLNSCNSSSNFSSPKWWFLSSRIRLNNPRCSALPKVRAPWFCPLTNSRHSNSSET